ncbi:hypothetical protein GCM10009087_10320 [Sphingomonas oligophenolica]|uniref:TrbC/VirB2 family protein n=1 Tax=Sphingomonas oligophenolica TaxID=301154 RepID=A0ABU9Y8I5_9SPHN
MITLMISDQASSPAILAGVTWARDALLGTVATSVAVICVAGVGYEILKGRVPARRLATVIIGCFILFGASDIATALSALAARGSSSDQIDREPPAPVFTVPPRTTLKTAPDPFDPYAGASVPTDQ